MGNYRCFLQGPFPVANYTRIIIPGRFWTRPPSTKSTRMASSATPLHDSLIELANPDAHAHAIKWYLKGRQVYFPILFSFYKPDLVQQHLQRPLQMLISADTGFFLRYNYQVVSIFKADFTTVGGFADSAGKSNSHLKVPFNCVGVSVRNG